MLVLLFPIPEEMRYAISRQSVQDAAESARRLGESVWEGAVAGRWSPVPMACSLPFPRFEVWFEEVSLGYPGQWRGERGIEGCLRRILPAPAHSPGADSPYRW